MKCLTVFSDASFDRSGAAGYAFFVRDEETIIKRAFTLRWKAGRSTEVELFAMCHAILHAIDNLSHQPGDVIVAQSDCTHVLHCFKSQTTNEALSVLGAVGVAGLSLRFKHVKAHTGTEDRRSYVNRWCDIQARREMRKQRNLETL